MPLVNQLAVLWKKPYLPFPLWQKVCVFYSILTHFAALESGFSKYIDPLRPHIIRALTSYEDAQVCVAAAGLTGDICRCMDDSNVGALDEIMEQLVTCLKVRFI